MVLMATRSGLREANPHIDFDTKTHIPHPKFAHGPKVEYADHRGDSIRKMGPVSGQQKFIDLRQETLRLNFFDPARHISGARTKSPIV